MINYYIYFNEEQEDSNYFILYIDNVSFIIFKDSQSNGIYSVKILMLYKG